MSATTTSTTTPTAASTTQEAKAVTPDTNVQVMTTDVYGMFMGAFLVVLTLFVLFSTGSILAVLVLWSLVALIITVLVYYGFLTIDKLIGQAKQVKKDITPAIRAAGAPLVGSEVFHISDQQFTYDEAPAVCAAYGAEMATLEQIMDAYAKGAEWCSYGWSAGGMALYPTQRETWEILQNEVDPGKRTRCGRPGVNGGYFDPTTKFGVNCYGFKPAGKFTPPAPIPGTDTNRFKDMVNRFKEMMKSFSVDPYSRLEWSKYGNAHKMVEGFTNQLYGTAFKQEYFTPYGAKEDFANGDERYVEPVGETGLGNRARPLSGPIGLRGDLGPTGPKGDVGPTGPVGPQGLLGPVGPQGERGLQGEPGPLGPTGPTGPAGSKGDKGDRGERGLPGEVGRAVVGPTGPTGRAGLDGRQGPTGPAGPTGPEGRAATIPNDLSVNTLRIGDWRLTSANQGGNPVLNFTNVPKNHTAGQIFSVAQQGVVRSNRMDMGRSKDLWSGS